MTDVCEFDIAFTGAYDEDELAIGEIQLGSHWETFRADLSYWSTTDYETHWLAALQHLVAGAEISCLVTSLTDPDQTNFITTWPIYVDGDDVHVQNQLLFLDELDHPFDPAAPWASIDPRVTIDEDGQRISEWNLTLEDIRSFLVHPTPTD
jgi:hypothetical protein